MDEELADRVKQLITVRTECGHGWDQLLVDVAERMARDFPGARWLQCKEKMGQVRLYLEPDPAMTDDDRARFWLVLHDFEARSATICEVCGRPGSLSYKTAWVSTLCPEHRQMQKRDPQRFLAERRASGR